MFERLVAVRVVFEVVGQEGDGGQGIMARGWMFFDGWSFASFFFLFPPPFGVLSVPLEPDVKNVDPPCYFGFGVVPPPGWGCLLC